MANGRKKHGCPFRDMSGNCCHVGKNVGKNKGKPKCPYNNPSKCPYFSNSKCVFNYADILHTENYLNTIPLEEYERDNGRTNIFKS